MNTNELGQAVKVRKIEPGETHAGIIRPKGGNARLFAGWGPRLLIVALGTIALNAPHQAAASPFSMPGATCPAADRDATLVENPIPDIPSIARAEDFSGDAYILVNLDAEGSLRDASVAKSSGNPSLDAEALRVARESEYAPAVSHCEPVSSSYLYKVTFNP